MFTPEIKAGPALHLSVESAGLTHSLRTAMNTMGENTHFTVTAQEANVDIESMQRTLATLRAFASSLRRKEAIKQNGKYSFFQISYLKNDEGVYVLTVSRGEDRTPEQMVGLWEVSKLKGRGNKKKNKDEAMQLPEIPAPAVDVRVPANLAFSA